MIGRRAEACGGPRRHPRTLADRAQTSRPQYNEKLGGTAGSVVPSSVFGVRNLRGMAKGEHDARRGSVFDL